MSAPHTSWRVTNSMQEWSASHDGLGSTCYTGIADESGTIVAIAVAHDPELWSSPDCSGHARVIAAGPALLAALKDALPGLRRDYVELASKYQGTRFEVDAAYQEIKARYINARDAIAAASGHQDGGNDR